MVVQDDDGWGSGHSLSNSRENQECCWERPASDVAEIPAVLLALPTEHGKWILRMDDTGQDPPLKLVGRYRYLSGQRLSTPEQGEMESRSDRPV
ncbi:hypothetical protein J1605_016173 [Eschrichtius robustus]|uniref:Uncharacterized protein n=1 Tax=Eschrichtius robustus TaxID=9764 RepID=A0AB34G9S6_ESCRO|nr:hypothetical protein J1605_016173 [Eschrichtius robustus]